MSHGGQAWRFQLGGRKAVHRAQWNLVSTKLWASFKPLECLRSWDHQWTTAPQRCCVSMGRALLLCFSLLGWDFHPLTSYYTPPQPHISLRLGPPSCRLSSRFIPDGPGVGHLHPFPDSLDQSLICASLASTLDSVANAKYGLRAHMGKEMGMD